MEENMAKFEEKLKELVALGKKEEKRPGTAGDQ